MAIWSKHTATAAVLGLVLGASWMSTGCLALHPTHTNPLANLPSNQPDKVLFDRAMDSMDHGKYTVARLTLETLLNTYPESEYQARAKMAIADAWYREGGTEGMAQAEAQYKDFITFFPTMQEASEAQLKVATIHFRQIQKPDRDKTEASRAQEELRTFLVQYPTSPLHDQALQMLRETQEVLAEGEFRVAQYYESREKYWAAQTRLEELLAKYPLYSRGDVATSMLAHSYLQSATNYEAHVGERPPEQRPLFQKQADEDKVKGAATLERLVERYPASPLAKAAQQQLAGLKALAPAIDAAQVAFNQAEIRGRTVPTRTQSFMALFRGQPIAEEDRSDKVGAPPLEDGAVETLAQLRGVSDTAAARTVTPQDTGNATGSLLQLQNIGPNTSLGVNTAPTATPSAVFASNTNPGSNSFASDPPPKAVKDDTQVLTPDEIDKQARAAILAEEVAHNVPYKSKPTPVLAPDPNTRAAPRKGWLGWPWF